MPDKFYSHNFQHHSAIYRESTKTIIDQTNTPIHVLFAHAVSIKILKF